MFERLKTAITGKPHRPRVSEIPKNIRDEAVDMLDNGWLVSDVAAELNVEPEAMYRINDQRKRMSRAKTGPEEPELSLGDPVRDAMRQLKAAQIQFEVDKLNFEREKLQADREEFFSIDDEPADTGGGSIENQALGLLLGTVLNKQQHPAPVTALQPSQQTIVTQPMPEHPALSDDELAALIEEIPKKYRQLIKSGMITKATAARMAREKMPGLSDEEIERAYQMVMTK